MIDVLLFVCHENKSPEELAVDPYGQAGELYDTEGITCMRGSWSNDSNLLLAADLFFHIYSFSNIFSHQKQNVCCLFFCVFCRYEIIQ
jgi:hypothetical protein